MERKYRYSDHFDNHTAYPICDLGEEDETTFQYWVEKFYEAYKEIIGDKQVYIIHN